MLPDILLEKLAGRSLLSAEDMGSEAWQKLIDFALDMKRGAVDPGRPLEGKTMSLVFFNSSLRTRSSMSVAVHQLGGYPLVLDIGGGVWGLETRQGVVMDGDRPEHIREAIPDPVLLPCVPLPCCARCHPCSISTYLSSWSV